MIYQFGRGKKVGASTSAVAARILATLSANERQKSSALIAEECGAENCRGRAGHWQTTRTCEDQHGQLQSAQTRTRCTCAGEADDKYAAGHTRRPWRCRLEKQKQRDDASVTSKNDIHCRTPGQSYEGGGRSRGHGSTDREWRKARSRRQKPYRRHHHGQLSSWQSRGDDSADRK